MGKIVISVLVFAFLLAAGGVHKIAYSPDVETIAVSQGIVDDIGETHCCVDEAGESETQNPRCLGDNCLASVLQPSTFPGDSQRLNIPVLSFSTKLVSNTVLRPPIA